MQQSRLYLEVSKEYNIDREIIELLDDEDFRQEQIIKAFELSNYEQNAYMVLLYFTFYKPYAIDVLDAIINLFDHSLIWYNNFINKFYELSVCNHNEEIFERIINLEDVLFNYSVYYKCVNDDFLLRSIIKGKINIDKKIINDLHYNFFLDNFQLLSNFELPDDFPEGIYIDYNIYAGNKLKFLYQYITDNKVLNNPEKISKYLNDEIIFNLIKMNIYKDIKYNRTLLEVVKINKKFIDSDEARQNEYYDDIIILWYTIYKYDRIYKVDDINEHCISLIKKGRSGAIKNLIINIGGDGLKLNEFAYYACNSFNVEMLEYLLSIIPLDIYIVRTGIMSGNNEIINIIMKQIEFGRNLKATKFEFYRVALQAAINKFKYKIIEEIINKDERFLKDERYILTAINNYDPFNPDSRETIIILLNIYGTFVKLSRYLELIKKKDIMLYESLI